MKEFWLPEWSYVWYKFWSLSPVWCLTLWLVTDQWLEGRNVSTSDNKLIQKGKTSLSTYVYIINCLQIDWHYTYHINHLSLITNRQAKLKRVWGEKNLEWGFVQYNGLTLQLDIHSYCIIGWPQCKNIKHCKQNNPSYLTEALRWAGCLLVVVALLPTVIFTSCSPSSRHSACSLWMLLDPFILCILTVFLSPTKPADCIKWSNSQTLIALLIRHRWKRM